MARWHDGIASASRAEKQIRNQSPTSEDPHRRPRRLRREMAGGRSVSTSSTSAGLGGLDRRGLGTGSTGAARRALSSVEPVETTTHGPMIASASRAEKQIRNQSPTSEDPHRRPRRVAARDGRRGLGLDRLVRRGLGGRCRRSSLSRPRPMARWHDSIASASRAEKQIRNQSPTSEDPHRRPRRVAARDGRRGLGLDGLDRRGLGLDGLDRRGLGGLGRRGLDRAG